MKLSQVMTRNPEVVHPDDLVQNVAERMRQMNVGAMPVTDQGRLVGIITDRDITVRATSQGLDPATARARDAMTSFPVFAYEDQDVREAAEIMARQQIRRLPILNRNEQLVGIVALGDLALDTNPTLSGEVLEGISEPDQANR